MAFLSLKAAAGSCTGQAASSAAPSSAPAATAAAGTPLPGTPTCLGLLRPPAPRHPNLPGAAPSGVAAHAALRPWVALVPAPALASCPLQGGR